MIQLYHKTFWASAQSILRDGFLDDSKTYMTSKEHTGVWFSDVPLLGDADGSKADTQLEVELELTEEDIAKYEWTTEWIGHREWLMPADFINKHGVAKIVDRIEPPDWITEL